MALFNSKEIFNLKQVVLIFFLLVILSTVLFLWWFPANHNDDGRQFSVDNSLPDLFGQDVTSVKYNPQSGIRINQLQAKIVKHYPDDITWLTQPRLWGYDKTNQIAWHAVSEKGKMLSDHKTFQLFNHVVVTRPKTTHQVAVHLRTKKMTLYTEKSNMSTDKPMNL